MAPAESTVGIVGGGPAGSVVALCLRRLGREVELFERERFPRYRIGESLLPGTLSILSRLDVLDRVEAAGFPKKRAATFLWGAETPWSFVFSTPKTTSWTFDYAYQVTRAEYDQILLDAAADRGARVRQRSQVTAVETGGTDELPILSWQGADGAVGTQTFDYLVDASGAGSVLAGMHGIREWDAYYRNVAVWSYFEGGRRYDGDLKGNTFSATFRDGWIWIIPLKDNRYSVGVVTGIGSLDRIKSSGSEAFFQESIAACAFTRQTLAGATRAGQVRVHRDWSYTASRMVVGRAFLCGDAACFIDPLFSQGVHLATYSAVLAASAIDHLLDHPEDEQMVTNWFTQRYRAAYDQYHQFLTAFYAQCEEVDSPFWTSRRVDRESFRQFSSRDWFVELERRSPDPEPGKLAGRAALLRSLWKHGEAGLSEALDETTLSLRRMRWAADQIRSFRRMKRIVWRSNRAVLAKSFAIHPTTFKLETSEFVGDADGRICDAFDSTEAHRALFESLIERPISYTDLIERLKTLPSSASPDRIAHRLFEEGFLEGSDEKGRPVQMDFPMRFGGVGGHDGLI
jgi:2-polyprenyl-6-methoxyphenol hydroxylase-like FAD-dependent oxidoreductase